MIALRAAIGLVSATSLVVGCGVADDGARRPAAVTLVTAMPRQGPQAAVASAVERAVAAAVARRGGRAGRFAVRFRAVDTSASEAGLETDGSCDAAAASIADAAHVVAAIGPAAMPCARRMIPRLESAGVTLVGLWNPEPGLTHDLGLPDSGCFACTPIGLHPTGRRTYVRIASTLDGEGAAATRLLRARGVRRALVLTDGEQFATAQLAAGFRAAAALDGLRVGAAVRYDARGPALRRLVAAIRRRPPPAIYLLAPSYAHGTRVLRSLWRTGYRGTVVSSRAIVDESVLRLTALHPDRTLLLTDSLLPLDALSATARRRARAASLEYPTDAAYAAEAAEVVLDAIARSDGSPRSVALSVLRGVRRGAFGPIAFDANGDVRPQRTALFDASGGRLAFRRAMLAPLVP